MTDTVSGPPAARDGAGPGSTAGAGANAPGARAGDDAGNTGAGAGDSAQGTRGGERAGDTADDMTDAVLDALAAGNVPGAEDVVVRPATSDDAVAGVPTRYVATPETTAGAAAVLRTAAAHQLAVVVRGAGTRQDWALPPRRADLVLDTRQLTGVVEHAAGDLVVVVRAGTSVEDLLAAVRPAGQQLALDVPVPGATVGGTVAVNASGPRRMLYGTLRDLLIGITVVRPDGVVARAGGKVVKNVAGYDLGKLMVGSYGTLGLVTECAFRLHPLPAASAVVRRRLDGPDGLSSLLATVRGSQAVPSALEVDVPPEGGVEVAVLLEGTASGVEHRAATVAGLLRGEVSAAPPSWWGEHPWRSGEVGLKLTVPLSRVPALVAAARSAAHRYGVPLTLRGSAGVGVLYAGAAGTADPDAVRRLVGDLRGVAEHVVVVTAPARIRDGLDVWGPVAGLPLMRRVKEQFDPQARFAPGRFVGGI